LPSRPFACRQYIPILTIAAIACASSAEAAGVTQEAAVVVQADQRGAQINPAMWGIFFEDINFGADGGLYAEMVKNRSFEFPDALMGWSKTGTDEVTIQTQSPAYEANPHYARLEGASKGKLSFSNEGFHGMGVKGGEKYDLTLMGRARSGSPVLRVELVDPAGGIVASAEIKGFKNVWGKEKVALHPKTTEPRARLRLLLSGEATLDVDMVSLFPRHTWKGRPGGLRADMVQMLADLKPGFMRFPGGCIVEGRYITNRYQWKTTIGAPETRKLIINRWNDEFKHRPAPDYYQSFGLGFFEFFQLCEDIGAEPMPILNCGMACQFNSGELVPMDQLDPYIQDFLDLIEFANGSPTSSWGSKRAAMGHPKPFGLKMIGVGNEQWGPGYIERYARFHAALKERHPEIQLISSAGPGPADDKFEFAWPKLRELHADIVDEHCYNAPKWFLDNAHRYDGYDRKGPKVFMGEYAAQSVGVAKPENKNTLECAVAEAAYMTGLERNADVVRLSSYAPLFGHVEGWQWTPNLIWCDDLTVYGTPNYYVQQLFSRNRGDCVLPTTLTADKGTRVYASTVQDGKEIVVKLVNGADQPISTSIQFNGVQKLQPKGLLTTISGERYAENSLTQPRNVAPVEEHVGTPGTQLRRTLPPWSVSVLRVKPD
jgi:alpha-L-arabinofuranosidase